MLGAMWDVGVMVMWKLDEDLGISWGCMALM